MKKIRLGVIGCGVLGTRHAEIYQKISGVELIGVYDIHPEKTQELANRLKVKSFQSLEDLINNVDAASVCTPAVTHHDTSLPLLKAGKHLLIEKPITTTLSDADNLLRVAEENKLILQAGHIERFNGAISAVKKIVKSPIFIECDRIGFFDPRINDVGVVLDLMVHDIDILLYFMNSPVKEISAVGMNILSNTEDFANCRITFENGAVGSLTASRMAQKRLRKIRIFEKNRYISLDYFRQEAQTFTKESSQMSETIYEPIDIRKSNSLEDELIEFVNSVRNNTKPAVGGKEARAALEVALSVLEQIKLKNEENIHCNR